MDGCSPEEAGLYIRPGTNNEVVQRVWGCLCHSWLAVGGVFYGGREGLSRFAFVM